MRDDNGRKRFVDTVYPPNDGARLILCEMGVNQNAFMITFIKICIGEKAVLRRRMAPETVT